jgi:hypothetical protein
MLGRVVEEEVTNACVEVKREARAGGVDIGDVMTNVVLETKSVGGEFACKSMQREREDDKGCTPKKKQSLGVAEKGNRVEDFGKQQ